MKNYASLSDFDAIVKHLMHDPHVEPLPMTLGEETACLSLLLKVYVDPDMSDSELLIIIELARKFADDIMRRYPFAEGYIDYLFGLAALERADLL